MVSRLVDAVGHSSCAPLRDCLSPVNSKKLCDDADPSNQTQYMLQQQQQPPRKRGRPRKNCSAKNHCSKTSKKKKKRPIFPPKPASSFSSNDFANNSEDSLDFRLAKWALPLLGALADDAAALCNNLSLSSSADGEGGGGVDAQDLKSRSKVIRLKISLLEAVVEMMIHAASWTVVEVRM